MPRSFHCFLRMVRNYKKKKEGARRNLGQSQEMVDAYNAVLGKQIPLSAAARYYSVNKKSLLRRVTGEIPVNAHVGRPTALSVYHEKELAECIKLMADWGYGFSKGEVLDIVQEFITKMDIETPFKDGRPSYDWLKAFLKRHPHIAPRRTEQICTSREKAEDPEVIEHWFRLLDNVLTEAGVKDMPAQIFNSHESGFVTDPKSDVILARKGATRVNQKIGGSGKNQITVNFCAAASGKMLPPYVVYKSKNLHEDWIVGGPDGTGRPPVDIRVGSHSDVSG